MRLFADHCVPSDVIHIVRELGLEVGRALEAGLECASDEDLFARARKRGQVLLTTDRDFGNIARFDIRHSPGVVILELEALSKSALLRRVEEFFRRVRPRSLQGKLTLVEPIRTRTWPKR